MYVCVVCMCVCVVCMHVCVSVCSAHLSVFACVCVDGQQGTVIV